jgi:hypothetical protein
MMLTHSRALWRIEYQIDLARVDSPVIPIAYMLEAHWCSGVRWLGMLFRKRLMPLEIERVDLETWPEMKDVAQFMNRLFDRAWTCELSAEQVPPQLGSSYVALNYANHSSLRFVTDEPRVDLDNEDPERSFTDLYKQLLGFHEVLSPRLVAEVHPFRQPKAPIIVPRRPLRADVEQVSRAA